MKAEISEPELDTPEEGFLGENDFFLKNKFMDLFLNAVPNIDLPALCSPRFKPGPPGDEAQVLSDRLNEVLSSCVCHCSYFPA